jgi:hypothetical protein
MGGWTWRVCVYFLPFHIVTYSKCLGRELTCVRFQLAYIKVMRCASSFGFDLLSCSSIHMLAVQQIVLFYIDFKKHNSMKLKIKLCSRLVEPQRLYLYIYIYISMETCCYKYAYNTNKHLSGLFRNKCCFGS